MKKLDWIFVVLLLVQLGCSTKLSRFIDSDKVLYYNNFDQHDVGYYTETDLCNDLYEKWAYSDKNIIEFLKDSNGVMDGRTTIIIEKEGNRDKVLCVLYPKWSYRPKQSGAQWEISLGGEYEELYCSYWVKFLKEFEFVKGGKLPGFAGGAANTGGKKPNGMDGWSVRIMWKRNGNIVCYVYHPDQPSKYGEGFPGIFNVQECRFIPGKWHYVEQRIKMNDPGQKNGVIQVWLDGNLVLDIKDMRFRDVDSLKIDKFLFDTFFGGNDDSWAAKKREYVYFDEIIISKNRFFEIKNKN